MLYQHRTCRYGERTLTSRVWGVRAPLEKPKEDQALEQTLDESIIQKLLWSQPLPPGAAALD